MLSQKWASAPWLKPFLIFGLIVLALLLGLFLRASNLGDVRAADGHLRFFDPDSYYQLRRLLHFISNFPQVMRFDPLLDWPMGWRVDWAPGFVWIYGLPLFLAGVSNQIELEWGVSFLNLLFGGLSILLVCWGAYRLTENKKLSIAAIFLAALSPILIRYTCFGQLDHHVLELLWPPLAFLILLRLFEKESWSLWVLLSLVAALALYTSPVSIALSLWIPVFATLAIPRRPTVKELLFFGMSYLLLMGLSTYSLGDTPLFSKTRLLSFLAVALLLASLVLLYRFASRKVFGGALGASVVGSLFFVSSLVGVLRVAQHYLWRSEDFLSGVLEAQPLFGKFSAADWGYVHQHFGYFVLPTFLFAGGACIFRSRVRAQIFWLALFSLPFVVLLLLQKRFQVFAAIPYLWLLVCMIYALTQWLRSRDLRVTTPVAILILALTVSPAFRSDFVLRPLAMHKVDFPVLDLFIQKTGISSESAWNRLAGSEPVDRGIVANPNLGHMFLYRLGLPTSDNSFYHEPSLRADLERRSLKSDQELLERLQKDKIQYVLVSDDLKYHRFLWKQFDPQAKSQNFPLEFYTEENGRKITHFDLDAMGEFAWYRLLTTETAAAGLEFVFGLRVPRSGHFYETVKVFEVKK